MNAEQITTIIMNLFTGGGVILFLGMWIRTLKKQIVEMNKTIEVQQQTLKAMETRVLETEKIGKIYRQLFDELLTEAEKWKVAILKFKDERISLVSDHVKVHKFEQMPVLHFSPISITTPVSPTFDQSNCGADRRQFPAQILQVAFRGRIAPDLLDHRCEVV